MKICSINSCGKNYLASGFCAMHYWRFKTHGDPLVTIRKLNVSKCSVDGCGKINRARGLCATHYWRWQHHGDPLTVTMRARGSGTTKSGYLSKMKDGVSKLEHRAIAEKAIGHQLPEKAVVHHFDGNPLNNVNANLVVCQDQTYHLLLHSRKRAHDACGHADWLRCQFCKTYDQPILLSGSKTDGQQYHLSCRREYRRQNKGAQL